MKAWIAQAFEFPPEIWPACLFPDSASRAGITFDPIRCRAILKADADRRYSTADNLRFLTPAISATAWTGWVGVAASRSEPEIDPGSAETRVRFRIAKADGTEYWWSGSAWAAPGSDPSHWNTLAEVQAHLAAFRSTSIRIAINLKTTDARMTPACSRVSIAYTVLIGSFLEDVILDRLIGEADSAGILSPSETEIGIAWTGGTAGTFDPDLLDEKIGRGVTSIYGATVISPSGSDPIGDVFGSWNPSTHALILSSSVAAGKKILIRARYQPHVVMVTHPDFDQVPGLPAVAIDSIESAGPRARLAAATEDFVREDTGDAISLPAPEMRGYRVAIRLIAKRSREVIRMAETIDAAVRCSGVLESPSVGLSSRIWIEEPLRMQPRPDNEHVHDGSLILRIASQQAWIGGAVAGKGVQRLVVAGDLNFVVE